MTTNFEFAHLRPYLLPALALVALLMAVALFVSWRRGRVDRWVSAAAGAAVLALSAEGTWVIAREKLHLPVALAVSVFFVAEAAMLSSAMRAKQHYAKHRNPGKHGRAVWVVATVAGVIVALNSGSLVEIPLRLCLPLAWAYLWWNELTADGVVAERSTWRWTPRRLLLAIGAIEPGERDMVEINRERQIAALTVTAHRLHDGSGRLRRVRAARLRKLALAADDDMITEARRRVERVHLVEQMTAPGYVPVPPAMPVPEVTVPAVLATPAPPVPVPVPAAQRRTERVILPTPDRRTRPRTETSTGPAKPRTDEELLADLVDVPRDEDGTVPVRRATAALGCGPDRARRLLGEAGLLRETPTPINGHKITTGS